MTSTLTDTRWGLLGPLVGFVLSSGVALSVDRSDRGAWLVLACFSVAVGTSAGALVVYGLRRWAELKELASVSVRDVMWPIGGAGVLAVLGINSTAVAPDSGYTWQVAALITGATLAGATTAGTLYAVGIGAERIVLSEAGGVAVARLLVLRRMLARLLETAGGFVLLITLLEGAQQKLPGTEDHRPPEYILVFGGFGSLLIALVFVPSWTRLRKSGERMCDTLLTLDSTTNEPDIPKRVADRQQFAANLGYQRSLMTELQTGLLIAAPLLTGATSAILSK